MDKVLAQRFLALEFEASLCVGLRLDLMGKVWCRFLALDHEASVCGSEVRFGGQGVALRSLALFF